MVEVVVVVVVVGIFQAAGTSAAPTADNDDDDDAICQRGVCLLGLFPGQVSGANCHRTIIVP